VKKLFTRTYPQILAAFGALMLLFYLIFQTIPVFWSRLFFPLGLDHQEEIHISILYQWLNEGKALYSVPSMDFSSWIYTPGYYFAAALWSKVAGLTLPSLRVFSWLCIFATCIPACMSSQAISKKWWPGLYWLPLYLAYLNLYGWIDLGMKDSFHILLCMLGVAFLLKALFEEFTAKVAKKKKLNLYLSALFWSLSFMTKQTTLFLLAPLVIPFFIYFRRESLIFCAATFLLIAAMMSACLLVWGNVFWTWVYVIPSHHMMDMRPLAEITKNFLIQAYPHFLIVLAALLILFSSRDAKNRKLAFFSLALLAGAALGSFIPAAKIGGGSFSLVLLTASLAFVCVWMIEVLRPTPWIALLVLLPLSFKNVDQRAVPPSYEDAVKIVMQKIHALPEKTWVAYHPWLAHLAGKKIYASADSIFGQWFHGHQYVPEEIIDAGRYAYFDYIVLDAQTDLNILQPMGIYILQNYNVETTLPPSLLIVPRDGWQTRHVSVFLKKRD